MSLPNPNEPTSYGVPIGYLPIYGPPTYQQFMDAYYADEMKRAYGPPRARDQRCGVCAGRGYLGTGARR